MSKPELNRNVCKKYSVDRELVTSLKILYTSPSR